MIADAIVCQHGASAIFIVSRIVRGEDVVRKN